MKRTFREDLGTEKTTDDDLLIILEEKNNLGYYICPKCGSDTFIQYLKRQGGPVRILDRGDGVFEIEQIIDGVPTVTHTDDGVYETVFECTECYGKSQ